MSSDKLKQLIDSLTSVGYEIAKINKKTRNQVEFDYDEIELLIYPISQKEENS